jgi:hypothetical protein
LTSSSLSSDPPSSRMLEYTLTTLFARSFFATCCYRYIDDDFANAGDSGQVVLGVLFNSVGIPFSDKKSQRPDSVQEELGVVCEFTHSTFWALCVSPLAQNGSTGLLECWRNARKMRNSPPAKPRRSLESYPSACIHFFFWPCGHSQRTPSRAVLPRRARFELDNLKQMTAPAPVCRLHLLSGSDDLSSPPHKPDVTSGGSFFGS